MTSISTRKNPLLILVVLFLAAASIFYFLLQRSSAPAIRHIVLISLDTTRSDHLGCYGYSKPTTPNIDALAEQGFLFTHAMTPVPLTLPAHTSMFTGTIPPHHGKRKNADAYFDPAHVTLAQLLKKKGFATGAFIGAQVLNRSFGLDRGFDTYQDQFADESHERRAEEVNRAAFDWLDRQSKADPVFMFIHYYDAHDEYAPPEPFATSFKEDPYAGEIAYADHCIGLVIEKLKSLNMYESTLLIVTGDHGEMLGEHGEETHMYFIYQSALKVPLVYKVPGSAGGKKISDLASIIDIVPTICDLAGVEPPEGIEGKNLAGYFRNQPPLPEDRFLYCESMQPTFYGANSLVGLASTQWKYIHTTRPELYDLQKDPAEESNLIDSQARQASILKENLDQISEAAQRHGTVQQVAPLDPELIRHLQSLGYVGQSSTQEDTVFEENKEDPKDLIDYHNAWHEAEHLVTRNKLAEALVVIENALPKRTGYVLPELATRICLKQEDYKNAIRFGKMALAAKPGYFYAHEKLAFAYTFANEDDAAAEQYELALKFMAQDQPDFQVTRGRLHFQLGMTRVRQEEFDLAIAQFTEAITLVPNQPIWLNTLASLLVDCPDQDIRNPAKAFELAQQACTLTQSRQPAFLKTLARAYAAQDNFNMAIKTIEKALGLARSMGDQALFTELVALLEQFQLKVPVTR